MNRRPIPLMPEFALVSTLVLIAAPVVLVGGAMLMALARKLKGSSDEGSDGRAAGPVARPRRDP